MGGIIDYSSNMPDPIAIYPLSLNKMKNVFPSWQQAICNCYFVTDNLDESKVATPFFTFTISGIATGGRFRNTQK